MPPSVQQPFHATNFAWQWFHIQKALVQQGILSVVAGVAVAWVILVLSSGNVIVGTMATLTIASVTVCVVGLIPLVDWKLGVCLNMHEFAWVGNNSPPKIGYFHRECVRC